jgi:multiple sugar transport system substrate-binding protein
MNRRTTHPRSLGTRTIGVALAALAAVASLALGACGGGDSGGEDDGTLTVWTLESEPDRIAAQEEIMDRFGDRSGTEIKVRGIEEDQLRTLITSAAAGGTLPDVMVGLPLAYVPRLADEQISDPEAANAVVEKLGAETFAQRALELVSVDGQAQAVPADAWGQMIFYRTDLFADAGLEPPTTFEALEQAASTLHSDDTAGIVLPTNPADTFTQESFEAFAIANGCQLVDESDTVTLDSPQCLEALELYTNLAKNYSVAGNQDVDTTRATYFAGKSAMVIWSSFLLDELAGLRDDAAPTCAECKDNPEFLVENTGVVTRLTGPANPEGAQYGDETTFAIMGEAPSAASDLVEYLMSDGYIDWISIAPEGKIPTRLGTKDDPREYIDQWASLEIGVDRKQRFDSIYSDQITEAVRSGAEQFDRWGFGHSESGGLLVGAALGELPMTTAIGEVVSSDADPAEMLEQAQLDYEGLQGP